MRTDAVASRTTLVLCRMRFHVVTVRGGNEQPLLAEDAVLLGFRGAPHQAEWLTVDDAAELIKARPTANINPEIARAQLERILEGFAHVEGRIQVEAQASADRLLEAHTRVRRSARIGGQVRVASQLPADILGVYVFLPHGGAL